MNVVVLDNNHIRATVDFTIGYPVLHMTLHKGITPSIYKYLKQVFIEDLLTTLGVLGYEILFAILDKDNLIGIKSAKVIGFEEERTVDGLTWLAQDIV